MRSIFVLMSGWLLLVPVLGLSSCSKDPRVDDWSMREPVIQIGTSSLPLNKANGQTLAYESALKFPGSTWASISIHSQCRLNSRSAEADYELSTRESILVRSLWPRDLTDNLSDTDLRQSSCDFTFSAKNKIGSTHDFSLANVKLERFVSPLSDAFLRSASLHEVASTVDRNLDAPIAKFDSLVNALQLLIGSDSRFDTVDLFCDGGHAKTAIQGDETAIANGLIQKVNVGGVESCRLLATSTKADTNVFAMTIAVPVRFSRVTLLPQRVNVFSSSPQELGFLRIDIANPGDEPTQIEVSDMNPRLRVSAASFQSSWRVSTRWIDDRGDIAVTGATSSGPNTFSVQPHATASFLIRLPETWSRCFKSDEMLKTIGIAGLRFGFLDAFQVQQLEDGAPIATLFSGAMITNGVTYPDSMTARERAAELGPVPDSAQPGSQIFGLNACF